MSLRIDSRKNRSSSTTDTNDVLGIGFRQSQSEMPWDITNGNGGDVALRYLAQTLLELARRGAHRAIVSVCAAGGMATAAYLERT
jgi:hypothetical protein